jgi:hypothetical protein
LRATVSSNVRVLLLLLAISAAAACGSVAPRPAASPSSPAAAGAITEAMDGQTVHLRAGSNVDVALRQQPGLTPWSAVATSDRSILMPVVNTRGTAVRGMTLASFQAVRAGTAQLTSNAGPDCSPGVACAQFERVFRVTVVVS